MQGSGWARNSGRRSAPGGLPRTVRQTPAGEMQQSVKSGYRRRKDYLREHGPTFGLSAAQGRPDRLGPIVWTTKREREIDEHVEQRFGLQDIYLAFPRPDWHEPMEAKSVIRI